MTGDDHFNDPIKTFADRLRGDRLRNLADPPVESEARKGDSDKVRFELIPGRALWEVAQIFTYGAKKYAMYNFMNNGGMKWSRYFGATMRHLWKWWGGEDRDPESGLLHLAHAGACVLILITYYHAPAALPNDDRFKEEPFE